MRAQACATRCCARPLESNSDVISEMVPIATVASTISADEIMPERLF
jgi:hypothetical protein